MNLDKELEQLKMITELLSRTESSFLSAIELIQNFPDDYNTRYPKGIQKYWRQIYNYYMEYNNKLGIAYRRKDLIE